MILLWGKTMSLKNFENRGAWVAQLVKCLALAQVMISPFPSSSPTSGSVLTAQSLGSVSDSVSPSRSLPLPRSCTHACSPRPPQNSKINIKKNCANCLLTVLVHQARNLIERVKTTRSCKKCSRHSRIKINYPAGQFLLLSVLYVLAISYCCFVGAYYSFIMEMC